MVVNGPAMDQPLLELRNVSCRRDDRIVFGNVNLVAKEGDVIVLRGRSGCGKTTLLKCIAHLALHGGEVLFHGSPPRKIGVPTFRTRVLYVPQRAPLLPGTPTDFMNSILALGAHRNMALKPQKGPSPLERAIDIGRKWSVEDELWERDWSNLSGGQAQRMALAVAVGLNTAEVLLLDEPTSALDSDSAAAVEGLLTDQLHSPSASLKAIIWITHSDEQGSRVGTKFVDMSNGEINGFEPV